MKTFFSISLLLFFSFALAGQIAKTCAQRRPLPAIGGVPVDGHARVAASHPFGNGKRRVVGAVIDDNQLTHEVTRQDAVDAFLEKSRLVVHGHHNAQLHQFHSRRYGPATQRT